MIGIVGGGLTGLALAHELARRGIEHVVLEAADRPGGVIRSGRVGGRVLERGPQRTRMSEGLSALVSELGIEREVIYAPEELPLYVYAAGALRRVPFSAPALLTGDLLSWRGKLRLLLEPLTARARDDEGVAELFVRKLGREAYERMVGPLFGGLYASDPADMLVGLSLGPLLADLEVGRSFLLRLLRRRAFSVPPTPCSFRNGLQTLTDALYARNEASVRLGSPALGLRRSGAGWAIELDAGETEADHVVLTCEAPAAAELLGTVAPDAMQRLERLAYNPLAIVHLHAPATGLRGLGYQVALGEDFATRGVTWNDSVFDREGVYTAFLGGAAWPAVVDEPDDRLGEIAAAEFGRVTGHDARPLAVARARMPAWDVSWTALEGLEIPSGIRIAANWWSRPGIPSRLAEARRVAEEMCPRQQPQRAP